MWDVSFRGSLYFAFPFIFIRYFYIKHHYLKVNEKHILKSDLYQGIALLENSIPIKLSLNREIKLDLLVAFQLERLVRANSSYVRVD